MVGRAFGMNEEIPNVSEPACKQPPVVIAAASEQLRAPEECVECGPRRKRRLRIIKNLLAVSFGFLLLFSSFQSLQNLQSSINAEQSLGTWALASLYAALVISCMFVPTYMIHILGLKYTIGVSMLMYSGYFMSNFYPTWWTMIPAAILLGIGGAPLWTSKCSYLTLLATDYAELMGQDVADVVTRFFGVFFMFFQTSQIWGNLISFYVLKPASSNRSYNQDAKCGIRFVDAVSTDLEQPEEPRRYLLSAIYTFLALMAALTVLVFLDSVPNPVTGHLRPTHLLAATLRNLRNGYQVAIVPLTIFSGLEQAFIVSDYTLAYVGCAWGIHEVGYVMITFGLVDATFSMASGSAIALLGRLPIFLLGAGTNAFTMLVLWFWIPNPERPFFFFLIAGCWGLADAIWQTQINAFYGVIFEESKEGAFANYRMWESIGFIVAFAEHGQLNISQKLSILTVFLAIGMAGYLGIELDIRRRRRLGTSAAPP